MGGVKQSIFIAVFAALAATVSIPRDVHAESEAWSRPTVGFAGIPSMVDMPTATPMADGDVHYSLAKFPNTLKNTLSFQISPRLSGVFRYSHISGFSPANNGNYFDRSFDVQYLLKRETDHFPAISVGLQDFGGTGIYSGEYVVATKTLGRIRATAGLGWGRFAGRGGFQNPLNILSGRFSSRPEQTGEISETGRLDASHWFKGDAAFFGGIQYAVSNTTILSLEYSSDIYSREESRFGPGYKSPLNIGLSHRVKDNLELGIAWRYGTELGVVLNYTMQPTKPRYPGGREPAPPALLPRDDVIAASWGLAQTSSSEAGRDILKQRLADQGIALQSLSLQDRSAIIYLQNNRYGAAAQFLGRAARILANTLPPEIERFTLVPTAAGVPLSQVTFRRSDLEELEHDLDGTWRSFVRADISDASDMAGFAAEEGIYPKFSLHVTPYLSPALFDPEAPVRADFGAQLSASYIPMNGLVFSGAIRKPLTGNLDESTRASNSVLPHVRSDAVLYDKKSDLELSYLTAEYFFRPGKNLYGRVTTGYLERMYGGVSAELLWHPVDSRLALGAEISYAVKRGFDLGLGFQDYSIATGHLSAYYDFGNGYLGQVDVGRYLAGDWGATVSLDREFDNGFRVGAFFTLTDVPFSQFGEGSFDKGIRITIPFDWLSGSPSQRGFGTTIRPVTRDGGARLDVRNRLYGVVRPYHGQELEDGWGKFWR